ncbi:MAG: hypothetical protein KGR98_09285 [Verrucomicrobia bacterium]|nr:hypothetical protein [Verrucomicrobiota bacterium]MDE3098478.1 hypothetical protein [Verrucomicrobiota bacterium]
MNEKIVLLQVIDAEVSSPGFDIGTGNAKVGWRGSSRQLVNKIVII